MKMELEKKEFKCKQLEKKVQGQVYSLNSSMDGGNLNPDYSNLGQQLQEQMDTE